MRLLSSRLVSPSSTATSGNSERRLYAGVPPIVEYELTPRGESLIPHINSLIDWAKSNMDDIISDRDKAASAV